VAAIGCQVAASGCKWLQAAEGASALQVAASWLPSATLKKSDFVDFTSFQDCSKWLPSGCQVAGGANGCQVAAKWLPSGCLSKWLQVAASGCQVAAKCYLEKKVIL